MMPALDEEQALPLVLNDLAALRDTAVAPWLDEIIVVDNGSQDRTAAIARDAGATVLYEPARGYGAACLRGIDYLRAQPPVVLVFMDADHSDHAADVPSLVSPILDGSQDLVVGSRTLGVRQRGALLPQSRVGNWIATGWIRLQFGFRYTDLGPFRAVRFATLERMGMQDRDFGWTVEMQVRALQIGTRVTEVPVAYRRRVGRSKISGTLSGSCKAATKILSTLWKLRQAPTQPARCEEPGESV
jgi:glycosyltransferase involved in cell wall biosynthesis